MSIEALFPRLRETGYQITSPVTNEYNCIAWAAGETDRWWWPDPSGSSYWPEAAPRQETVEAFLIAFSFSGFEPCSSDSFEEGFEKVAIYANAQGQPTHMARQLRNGRWTSKLGKLEDLEHRLDGLDGSTVYGMVAQCLKRSL